MAKMDELAQEETESSPAMTPSSSLPPFVKASDTDSESAHLVQPTLYASIDRKRELA